MLRNASFKLAALLTLAILAFVPAVVVGQTPTGTIVGQVSDTQGRPIANVTVTATSPHLQGEEKATSSPNGDYIFKFLPPGEYTLSFEARGFASSKVTRTVAAAEPVTMDVSLKAETVKEAVTVTAETGRFVHTIEQAANIKADLLGALPTSRTLLAAVNMAPAAHRTGPSNAFSINGAMSFENSFLINGVQIQDNLRGTPESLFIEDAIQETTIATSGISAEYGRFSGGVINAVTKSGTNRYNGSFRESFGNDNWRSVSPFGEPKANNTVPTSEFTAGGPIVKDRLWFFGAGRVADTTQAKQTGYTNTAYTFEDNEKRYEGKATAALSTGQRIDVDYTGIVHHQQNSAWPSPSLVMDVRSLTNPDLPESLAAFHYTGTFGAKFFLEAQYSARALTFKQSGGLQTDLVNGTVLQDQQTGAYWWAPNFCGVCPNEQRDNNSFVAKGSYFLSTGSGSHDLAFGYDGFNDKMLADNHQSGSDYHVWATGSEVVNGTVYPVIDNGFSTYIIHWPLQQNSQGTNFRTHAFFINDRWAYNSRLSFNLGLKYDKNAGRDSSGSLVAKDSMISPRLGMTWDPTGDGRTSIRLTAGRYVTAVNNSIAGGASAAGNPSIIASFYDGPGINTGTGPLVPSDVALQQVFAWYNAVKPDPFFVDIPGVATKINGSLKSPHSDEVTVGVSREFGTRVSVRADVITRKYADFYAERTDQTTGQVFDSFGQEFDLKLIENTNVLKRQYRALDLQADYRAGSSLQVGGNYTLSRLWGNNDGETINSGPVSNDILLYPEYSQQSWGYPQGDLALDQRHRARIWGVYDLPWARRVAAMSVGVFEQMESGTPYGAAAQVDVSSYMNIPSYATPPSTMTYYFTARDAYRTAAMYRTDLSFNVGHRVSAARGPEIFAQFQLLNAFNQFQAFSNTTGSINMTVLTAVDTSKLATFNPFTQTPVEGVNWKKGSKFGQPVSKDAYTVPRTFRFSVGVKF